MPERRHPHSPWMVGTVAALAGAGWLYHQLHRARRDRRTAEERLSTLAAMSTEPIVVVEGDGTVRWLSPIAEQLLGPTTCLLDRVVPTDRDRVAQAIRSGRGDGVPLRLSGQGDVWTELEAFLEDRRHDDLVQGVVVALRPPLTPADAMRWRHQALHDDLTRLANRGGLFESLELLADPTAGRPCAVVYADLDHFKAINDAHGHAAGDRVLQEIADRLRRQVRPGDTVARIGGDEFVLLIDAVADDRAAMEIAERIRASLGEPIDIGTGRLRPTASFGVATGLDHQASALLDRADAALYEAKRRGRDRCHLWTADLPAGTPGPRRSART